MVRSHPLDAPDAGLFWLLEQIPGYIESQDMTDFLKEHRASSWCKYPSTTSRCHQRSICILAALLCVGASAAGCTPRSPHRAGITRNARLRSNKAFQNSDYYLLVRGVARECSSQRRRGQRCGVISTSSWCIIASNGEYETMMAT